MRPLILGRPQPFKTLGEALTAMAGLQVQRPVQAALPGPPQRAGGDLGGFPLTPRPERHAPRSQWVGDVGGITTTIHITRSS